MLRVFLVFLSLRLSFPLPAALRSPPCAASSRREPRGWRGENRRSVSLSGKSPPPQSAWTPRRVRLHLIDADVYVGTASWGGEVLFRFAPLSSFPYILCCLALCATLACHCTGGVLALCKPPFGQCHCAIERRCVIPLEKPVIPLRPLPLYVGTAGWGGEVLFRFAFIVFFSLYSMLLGGVCNHCVQLHKRGIGALCAEFRGRIGPSAKPRTMPARATSGMSVRRQKTRGQLHGNGKLFAPPSAFVFERRARRVSSNRAAVVSGRRRKDTAAKETNAGQKRNL